MCLFEDQEERPLPTAFRQIPSPKDCIVQNPKKSADQVIQYRRRDARQVQDGDGLWATNPIFQQRVKIFGDISI